ncbi:MAG: hypothetical protein ACI9QQ_003121 [Myxococcota bacterium]|jgi:hypothetical protein
MRQLTGGIAVNCEDRSEIAVRVRPLAKLALTAALTLALGCSGPFIMLPGGALSGTLAAHPSDWAFSDATENVQLETRPSDPYSVNIWGVGVGEQFFVASGRGLEAAWAQHIADNPNVRLRIEGTIYELSAVQTQEEADRAAFLTAAKKKYDNFEPDEEEASTATLYRLEAR